jgi:hypothetical protein
MASDKLFSRALSQSPPLLAGFLGGLGLLAAIALGWAVRELGILLFALLVATFLATGLNRLVAPMANRGLPRPLAVTAVVLGILILVAGILLAVIPALVNQTSELIASLPDYYAWFMQTRLAERLGGEERLLEQLQSFATPENASIALKTFGSPSIPSGLSRVLEMNKPGENADRIVAGRSAIAVKRANHRQRALGSLPLGNSKSKNTTRPRPKRAFLGGSALRAGTPARSG